MEKWLLYRGTQKPHIQGVRTGITYTTSIPAAIIWSSRPGDVFANSPERREPAFLPGSTIHIARKDTKKLLELSEGNYASFESILIALDYGSPGGITEEGALKILTYMHHRLTGKAKGGYEFSHKVFDEEGEEIDEGELPLSFTDPETIIRVFQDEFRYEPTIETARRLTADTYIFADAPAVQRAAIALGYQMLWYRDLFAGGEFASEELLGIPVQDLQGVEMEWDLEDEEVATHETYVPLVNDAVTPLESVPTEEFLQRIDKEELTLQD